MDLFEWCMTLIIYRHCSQLASVSSSFSLCQVWGAARNLFTASSAIHIATPLTYIINLGLRTGVMPTHWKQARVCPIYKSGDRSECNNYRPISVLCGVSKIVVRPVHDALYTYLTEHNHGGHHSVLAFPSIFHCRFISQVSLLAGHIWHIGLLG